MSIYRDYRDYKQIQDRGLIIIGYQGIGKSSFASSHNKTIDLESSNFKVDGERDDNWYVIYCRIAVSLAKQGYIVFTSSHQVVVEEFMKYSNRDDDYSIVIVYPHPSLGNKWVEKLRQRWIADMKNEKNHIAYEDAKENFQDEIYWLASQNELPCISIKTMDYVFSRIVEGLCCIYGVNRYCRSMIPRRRNYDEDED